MKRLISAGLVAMMLLMGTVPVHAMTELSDHQLEQVTAGASVSSNIRDGVLHFHFQRETPTLSVSGGGTLETSAEPLPGSSGALILHNSNANLNGLVNIIAVNSVISVLLNLNVNINSRIGSVHQWNGGRL